MTAPQPRPFIPSKQQQGLFDWVEKGKGSANCIAVAGSGKSTALRYSMGLMTGQVASMAFNKKIADENQAKMPKGIRAQVTNGTFHSVGNKTWKKVAPHCQLEGEKLGYKKAERIAEELKIPFAFRTFVAKATLLAKQSGFGFLPGLMMSQQSWLDLVDHFDLQDVFANENGDMPYNIDQLIKEGINWTVRAIRHGIKIAREVIDFEDMIYMPLVGGCQVWQYDWVLVDEAQDTNATRRAFAKKLLRPGGRAIFVGDPHQAIYGFTGADAESLQNIKKEFGCIELPLTITYRCPKSVVLRARTWVKHITAADTAPEGICRTIQKEEMLAMDFSASDAILCRNTAPLVELAMSFIRRNIPCHIEGKELGQDLVRMVRRWKNISTINQLVRKLEDLRDREVPKLMAQGKEQKAEKMEDTVNTLLAFIENIPTGSTLDVLEQRISAVFLDASGEEIPTLTLSTIHKSKGREWPRVFWYGNNIFQPSKFARQQWQQEQEDNLMYVACTRAMDELIEVQLDPKKMGPRRVA
jgi:superfamily I DNA/RNA helicase